MRFTVENMTCGHCVLAITGALQRLDPNAQVAVDLVQARVEAEGRFNAAQAIEAMAAEGYLAILEAAALPPSAGTCCGHCG